MSYITAIGTANPANRIPQSLISDFMLRTMHVRNGEGRKLKAVFRASGIDYRHSVLNDFGSDTPSFFPASEGAGFPSTAQRLSEFRKHALPLSLRAAQDAFRRRSEVVARDITHLVVVCCTGMYAPGLDIDLVHGLGLPTSVHRTAINFMGCYAAFNALKIADAFCRQSETAKVLIVCTELCSLHFQPDATDDNLLANALFGDGSAAVIVESSPAKDVTIHIEAFHNELASSASEEMAWNIGNEGFEMRLSAYVPDAIAHGIKSLAAALFKKIPLNISQVKYFAIHPGGKRILEVVERELGLLPENMIPSSEVLRNFGNMSSATILFVLQKIMAGLGPADAGERILGFAFGPGLTMESMLLKIRS